MSFWVLIIYLNNVVFLRNYLMGKIIDTGSAQNIVQNNLYIFVGAYLGTLLLNNIANGYLGLSNDIIRIRARVLFTKLFNEKISSLDLENFETPSINNSINVAKDNYRWVPDSLIKLSLRLLAKSIAFLLSLSILFLYDFKIATVLLVLVIPLAIQKWLHVNASWEEEKNIQEPLREFKETSANLHHEKSVTEIKVFKSRRYLVKKSIESYGKIQERYVIVTKRFLKYLHLANLVNFLGFSIGIYSLTNSLIDNQLSIGEFTFYLSTMFSFRMAIVDFITEVSTLSGYIKFSEEIFNVLDIKNKIINGTSKVDSNHSTPPLIEFKNVWFKYPNTKKYIFKNLNFKINPGDNIALVGKNGAGKSTFIKLICRFYDVTKGEILINGTNIKELDVNDWYRYIALLSQDFIRYHFDAATNIGMGNVNRNSLSDNGLIEATDLKDIKIAAKMSGADEVINEFENKYEQILSKRFTGGTEPSVGQWQKIALARAFYKDAPILILDEPTSAIDPKSEYEIFNNIFDSEKEVNAKDKSIIIISHRFSTVRNASKIIVIDKGEMIEQGSHEELMKLDGVYKETYEIQKKGYED